MVGARHANGRDAQNDAAGVTPSCAPPNRAIDLPSTPVWRHHARVRERNGSAADNCAAGYIFLVAVDEVDSPFAHVPVPRICEVPPLTWEGQVESAAQFARGASPVLSPVARRLGLAAIGVLVLVAAIPVAILVVALIASLLH